MAVTLVNLTTLATTIGGPEPVNATLKATYWAGYDPITRVVGDDVIFPDPIVLTFTDGVPAEAIEMEPTAGVACVKWELDTATSERYTRYTTIPGSGPVDFGDLPVVDPHSYTPVYSTLDEVDAAREATESYLAANPLWLPMGQAVYDALLVKDPDVLYVITGP